MEKAACGCEHTLIKHVTKDDVEFERPIVTSRIGKFAAKAWCRKCGWITVTDEQVSNIDAKFNPGISSTLEAENPGHAESN